MPGLPRDGREEASRRPIQVLAPPSFSRAGSTTRPLSRGTVTELFGESSIRVTCDAASLALARRRVKDIASDFASA